MLTRWQIFKMLDCDPEHNYLETNCIETDSNES